MTAPLTVYKDAGKWWYDCRLCGTANPNSSATRGLACEQAGRHYLAIHTYSPFDRRVA